MLEVGEAVCLNRLSGVTFFLACWCTRGGCMASGCCWASGVGLEVEGDRLFLIRLIPSGEARDIWFTGIQAPSSRVLSLRSPPLGDPVDLFVGGHALHLLLLQGGWGGGRGLASSLGWASRGFKFWGSLWPCIGGLWPGIGGPWPYMGGLLFCILSLWFCWGS